MLTLEIPFLIPTITINLPNAQLGNKIGVDNRQKLSQAMSGDLYTYVQTNRYELIDISLQGVPRTDLEAVANALRTNGEDDWKITDHEGRVWNAKLLVTPISFTMALRQFIDGAGATCEEAGTVSLQFTGIRQP